MLDIVMHNVLTFVLVNPLLSACERRSCCSRLSDRLHTGSIQFDKSGRKRQWRRCANGKTLEQQGTPALMSVRCHNQTSCYNLRRLLRESSVPHRPKTATETWEILQDTMHRTALATFGEKTSKTHDWFDAKSCEIRPVAEAKRTALIEYKRSPNERNLHIIRAARSKVQQTARRCANEYWTQLAGRTRKDSFSLSLSSGKRVVINRMDRAANHPGCLAFVDLF